MLPASPLANGTRASIGAGAPSGLLRAGCTSLLAAPATKHERAYCGSTRAHVAMRAAQSRCAASRRPDMAMREGVTGSTLHFRGF